MRNTFILLIFFLAILFSCSRDTSKHMVSKKFKESDNTAVFTTKFVITDHKDITTVTHDKEDGAWQFFSNDHFDHLEDVAKVVALGEIIEMDSTLLDLADLPPGFSAHRKFKGDKWVRKEER